MDFRILGDHSFPLIFMTTDMAAPATKKDIAQIVEMIDFFSESTDSRFNTLEDKFTNELKSTEQNMKLHFDFMIEQDRFNQRSANREEILVMKDNIKELQEYTGLRKAA